MTKRTISAPPPSKPLYYRAVKRTVDIFSASAGLLLLLPVFAAVAVAIKLDSQGPVFFSQPRLGENGRPFRFYKLRSMTVSAPDLRLHLADHNEALGPVFKIRQDPRITRVGRFLRKASIDELPQLWHVLVGQMSLVGPRPPIPEEVEGYQAWQTERLAAKPGLTCTWQVSGRSDIPFDDWVRLDIEYVRNRCLLLDTKLLLQTIPAVFTGRGAY